MTTNEHSFDNADCAADTLEFFSASGFGLAVRSSRNRQRLKVLLLSVLVLAVIGLIRFTTNAWLSGIAREQESVIEEYMSAMTDGDAVRAYTLFSSRAQRQMTVTDIERLMRGETAIAFQGYQSAQVADAVVRIVISLNPNGPQGFVVQTTGTIRYEDGMEGSFAAVLERSVSRWRLFNVHVTPPLEKLKHVPQAKSQYCRLTTS